MRLGGSPARIDHHHSFRLAARDRHVPMAHPSKEASTLLLKAVLVFLAASVLAGFLIAAPRPLHAKRNVGVHEDGQIRLQIATKNLMKLEHRPASQLPPGALV